MGGFILAIASFFIIYLMIRKAVEHGTLDALLEFEKIKQKKALNDKSMEEENETQRKKSHSQQLVEKLKAEEKSRENNEK